jgi:uracil-DNA glycosylase
MAHDFDPGYGIEPFRTLCREFPDETVYPKADFRVEWGPIFHRGRLDGTARLVVIGQDPATHETVLRRILVGAAGKRFQGFMHKLGLDRSYVLINTFLYSVYGQGGGSRHKDDPAIAAYRHRWLDALLLGTQVQAVVALGTLADAAWQRWRGTPAGAARPVAYAHVTHPTQPESSSGNDAAKRAAATAKLLENWNAALDVIHPAVTAPDTARRLVHYGATWKQKELVPIPEADLPPGLPAWMRGDDAWASREGATATDKRRTLVVAVPAGVAL